MYPYSTIGVIILVLNIIALWRLLSGTGSFEHKLLWTVVIVLLPVIGMVLYFAIADRKTRRMIEGQS